MSAKKNKVQKKLDPRVETLFSYRVRLGLTLKAVSERTRLSIDTIRRIERGEGVSDRSRILLQDGLDLSEKQVDAMLRFTRTKNFRRKRKR